MVASTRGPLPPGVYWRRRLAALSVALVLFLGVGKVLDLSSDGSSGDETAQQAGSSALAIPTATVSASDSTPAPKKGKHKDKNHDGNGGKGSATPTPTPTPTPTAPATPVLPDPTGPCADGDVYVTPTIPVAVGGADVTITLNLQTRTAEACTWHVSADTLTMNIVSGPDKIWLSKQCPKAIPDQDVVVRLASVTQVPVVWNARRSDDECSDRTAWALPGFYHARAAAYGGEPTDVQFELTAPAAPTVTETAQPGGGKGNGTKSG
jgi:hypothetical protein